MKDDLTLAILIAELPPEVVGQVTGLSKSAVFRARAEARVRLSEWSQASPTIVPERSQALARGHLTLTPASAKAKAKRDDTVARAITCPLDFKPREEDAATCRRYGVDPDEQAREMIDWSHSNKLKNKKTDWDAAFRNWARKRIQEVKEEKRKDERFGKPRGLKDHEDNSRPSAAAYKAFPAVGKMLR